MAKLKKSQKTLNRAIRSQRTQANRINKMIAGLEMQGFTFDYKFKQRVNNIVTSTPSNAKRKAKQLKAMTKTELYKHASSYITDDYQILTGSEGIKEGRRLQRRKNKLAKQASGIQNVDDAISNLTDYVIRDKSGNLLGRNERIDKSPMKRKIAEAWQSYKEKNPSISFKFASELAEQISDAKYTDTGAEYDSKMQRVYNQLTGENMPASVITEDESIADET